MPRSRPERCPGRPVRSLVVVGAVLAGLLMLPAGTSAEHEVAITGRVINGTSGGTDVGKQEVNLHVINAAGEVDVTRSSTGGGRFRFEEVKVDVGSSYTLTAEYQDVVYSVGLDPSNLEEPAQLMVYDTTSSLEEVRVGADVMLIRGADGSERLVSAFEVVTVVNEGDRTFVPDISEPAQMRFLRFSVPTGIGGLRVSSDLPGGEVIDVPTGFALIAPVTPGSHQLTFSYTIPYAGSELQLTRSFPMGVETFRLLLERESGVIRDPGFLDALPPAGAEGDTHSAWGSGPLSPGTKLTVGIADLPEPSALHRLGEALTEGPYLKVGIPSAVGAVLATLLVYSLVFRRTAQASQEADDSQVEVPFDRGQ